MIGVASVAIVLRFRDLVTELGGTIAEHRRIMRHHGHAWWGWWRREAEYVPKAVMAALFVGRAKPSEVSIILFDSGTMRLYGTRATRVVVSPTPAGIQSPEFEATPEYYVRGQYPLWFRLEGDITLLPESVLHIIAAPTTNAESDFVPSDTASGRDVSLDELQVDRPTLWLARPIDPKPTSER